jgi:hypothetical protein
MQDDGSTTGLPHSNSAETSLLVKPGPGESKCLRRVFDGVGSTIRHGGIAPNSFEWSENGKPSALSLFVDWRYLPLFVGFAWSYMLNAVSKAATIVERELAPYSVASASCFCVSKYSRVFSPVTS